MAAASRRRQCQERLRSGFFLKNGSFPTKAPTRIAQPKKAQATSKNSPRSPRNGSSTVCKIRFHQCNHPTRIIFFRPHIQWRAGFIRAFYHSFILFPLISNLHPALPCAARPDKSPDAHDASATPPLRIQRWLCPGIPADGLMIADDRFLIVDLHQPPLSAAFAI